MRARQDKNYFHFTLKERNGIFLLVGLAILGATTSMLYSSFFKVPLRAATRYKDDIARLKAKSPDTVRNTLRYTNNYKNYKEPTFKRYKDFKGELFYFDPNTISESEWSRLGLGDKTISTIKNYLAKGGRFREPDDLKKIWGLHEDLANKLIPYTRIVNHPEKFVARGSFEKKVFPTKTYEAINLNESDTAQLTALPGIGPRLSQRIIKYRDKLGGFYSVDQVGETFGLPDSTFKKIRTWLKVDKDHIKIININSATIDELKSHPYIRYHLANAMIEYRRQHSGYTSVKEIRNIMLVDDTTYQKLVPYLAVD